tara:strand:- start:389 stop:715 length:327 start_codon:yes stop_codon:yes gene_type:complete
MRIACLLGLLLIAFSSCYKTKQTTLNVQARTNSGAAVVGASITVKGVPPENSDGNALLIYYQEATNSKGIAFFHIENIYKLRQSGSAIVEVKAQKLGVIAEEIVDLVL